MDENVIKIVQIKKIQLNPRFCSQEMFNDIKIKNQGIEVETELEKDTMVEIITPDDTR